MKRKTSRTADNKGIDTMISNQRNGKNKINQEWP